MKALPSLLLVGLLGLPLPGFAQQPSATPQAAPIVVPPTPEPDPAMLKAMKSKVFEIKHRSPDWLASSLRGLGSGVRGSRMDSNDQNGLNTITVRDFPEIIAAIEEALKRLDVPSIGNQAPDLELHIHVLFAHKAAVSNGGVSSELLDVIKTLKGTLAYQGYSQVASFIQRTRTQPRSTFSGRGSVDQSSSRTDGGKELPQLTFRWSSNGVGFEAQKDAPGNIQLRLFALSVQENGSDLASFSTDLNFKEGERVVVGTSTIKDKGLVVVLTARRVN